MGYRGSKSTTLNHVVVKEQRVDDNRYNKILYLRYALMGFERNYLANNLLNLTIHKRYYKAYKLNLFKFNLNEQIKY